MDDWAKLDSYRAWELALKLASEGHPEMVRFFTKRLEQDIEALQRD